ncbi:MAG TPA: DUF4097 family beta strand repeat-containing protein [Steroidobacteraceae bacterium]|jgi:hypothetical protein|nr:DUF4097 family beta strand repeat-containing protein [Steroidobacteraceae bacterium]
MTTSTARLLVITVAVLGTSAALAAQRTYDKRLDAPPGGRLTFDADAGSVVIVGRDAPEVVIHADVQGPESFLEGLRISAEQTSSGVTVSAHSAHNGWFDWSDWFNFGSTRVRFDVEIPHGYPVDLRTSGGRIDVRDLNAEVRAGTSGGGVVVQDVAGTVNAHTSGGSIEAERLNGPTRLTTSGGSIAVTDSTGDLYARTSGGSIRIQNEDGRVDARTSGGAIRAELRTNRGVTLATSGGSITLLLPQDTHAAIEAATSGGHVTSDFPLTTTQVVAGNDLRGTVGGGGLPISLHTSGGSIHIEPE